MVGAQYQRPFAKGGQAEFKKLEFMVDGGKVVKGASNLMKKLFADSKVLPQAEREANLQKFLTPSAEKRRMYHGSKEPNITEFKTRKDLTNEDNMTGHYADERDAVFLSPDPEFSKDFSVWGYTDEGKAPTTYPVYAQVEKPFDFDNPEHLKKVKATYLDMFHNPESEFYDPHITSSERSMDLHRFNQKVDDLPKDENNWGRIENQQFQDVLKDLGFDSFYTRERGTKNLGIYDPNRIKSAIGNRGTYDLGESDINKSDGGKIVKGLSKVAKKLLEEPRIQTIEAPSIIIPSKLSNVKEMARKREGEYGARRVERASDEIPNLEKMYQEDALRRAFIGGDNARALMTMNPADFENYAAPLDLKTSIGPKMAEYAKQGDITKDTVPTDEFIKYLRSLQDGFEDIPMLTINKEESGLPLVPFITGHEGRHRNRALAESGQPTSLIQLYPRAELREPFPRRSQEEYIDAIRKEMEMTGNMVRPEVYFHNILEKNVKRDPIKLPDLYADGGAAFKTLQFKDAQHFDRGGLTTSGGTFTPEELGVSADEIGLTKEQIETARHNAPIMLKQLGQMTKDELKDEYNSFRSAGGAKDFALRFGSQYLGGIPDLVNLGLMGVDALADTKLASEKPWFGSEQYIEKLKQAGILGENEFPLAEIAAGILAPAGLIKKGIKKISGVKPAKQEPKKRQGGLSAMAR
jgi:hypothetical protein